MNKIPPKLKEELRNDPHWRVCTLADENCKGRVQWHHNFKYANKQIQEKFSIISLCKHHHEIARGREHRDLIDWICISRATPEELAKYPRTTWGQMFKFLNNKYGKFKERS
jgi:hypothetical protein